MLVLVLVVLGLLVAGCESSSAGSGSSSGTWPSVIIGGEKEAQDKQGTLTLSVAAIQSVISSR